MCARTNITTHFRFLQEGHGQSTSPLIFGSARTWTIRYFHFLLSNLTSCPPPGERSLYLLPSTPPIEDAGEPPTLHGTHHIKCGASIFPPAAEDATAIHGFVFWKGDKLQLLMTQKKIGSRLCTDKCMEEPSHAHLFASASGWNVVFNTFEFGCSISSFGGGQIHSIRATARPSSGRRAAVPRDGRAGARRAGRTF